MKYDSTSNGGKLTNRDVWNTANHEPLKLVVVNKRYIDGDIFDARYILSAERGVKLACERATVKEWFIDWDEDPCRYCEIDNKDKCDQSTLKVIEDDILLLDTLPPQYEGVQT